jgi:hypothetical protein
MLLLGNVGDLSCNKGRILCATSSAKSSGIIMALGRTGLFFQIAIVADVAILIGIPAAFCAGRRLFTNVLIAMAVGIRVGLTNNRFASVADLLRIAGFGAGRLLYFHPLGILVTGFIGEGFVNDLLAGMADLLRMTGFGAGRLLHHYPLRIPVASSIGEGFIDNLIAGAADPLFMTGFGAGGFLNYNPLGVVMALSIQGVGGLYFSTEGTNFLGSAVIDAGRLAIYNDGELAVTGGINIIHTNHCIADGAKHIGLSTLGAGSFLDDNAFGALMLAGTLVTATGSADTVIEIVAGSRSTLLLLFAAKGTASELSTLPGARTLHSILPIAPNVGAIRSAHIQCGFGRFLFFAVILIAAGSHGKHHNQCQHKKQPFSKPFHDFTSFP